MVKPLLSTLRDLVPHLLGDPFTSEKDKKDLVHVLRTFKRIVSGTGLIYWLDYGALLGAYRWGNMLPWDHDLDISYLWAQGGTLMDTAPDFEAHGMELSVGRYGIFYENVKVDLEPWLEIDGLMIRANHLDYEGGWKRMDERHDRFPSQWVNPLYQIYLAGDYYNCPNQVERLLRKRYTNIDLIVPHRVKAFLYPRLYRYYRVFARYEPRIREPLVKKHWTMIDDPRILERMGVEKQIGGG